MAFSSFNELLAGVEQAGSLASAALQREVLDSGQEPEAVRALLRETLEVMRASIAEGLSGSARSRSGLVGGDAAKLASSGTGPIGGTFAAALAGALAVAEVNASMGRIVAAPTGGASGVLPGVLLALAGETGAGEDDLVDALLVAGAVGGVIAARGSLSGAAGGCQAEVGAGSAMAAAAAVQLMGGRAEACEHAASLALQGLLGLVCDPVGGLVEVPCVVRNATGASVALAAAEMALAGVEFPIPFDQVADAAAQVGRSLPPSLRETAAGGLAATPTGRELAQRSRQGSR